MARWHGPSDPWMAAPSATERVGGGGGRGEAELEKKQEGEKQDKRPIYYIVSLC